MNALPSSTTVAPIGKSLLLDTCAPRRKLRLLSDNEFIDRHASGSLRKAHQLGLATRELYLHERVAYEYGWGFDIAPATRVTVGRAVMEGDCRPLTEACWHYERLLFMNPLPDADRYQIAYIRHEPAAGPAREGVGIVLVSTLSDWLPEHHCVFAIVAPFDPKTHAYLPAENPF